VSFTEDRGTGLGVLAIVAQHRTGVEPYAWRMQVQAYTTVLSGPDGLETSFQEHQVLIDAPGLAKPRLGLEASWARHTTAAYYGQGSQSQPVEGGERLHQYDHLFPNLTAKERIEIGGAWEQFGRITGTRSLISLYPDSLLATEVAAGAAPVGLADHFLLETEVGGVRDTRDNETWTTRGILLEGSLRGGHRTGTDPGNYMGSHVAVRGFLPLLPRHAVLAARVLVDGLHGETPLYRLDDFGGLEPASGPGGKDSVRGVPEGTHHAPLKSVANLELRTRFWYGSLLRQPSSMGLVAFIDAGSAQQFLGEAPALAAGAGLGLRAYLGSTFALRVDRAWSSQDDGLYITVNEMF
jgi:hypothetical protein